MYTTTIIILSIISIILLFAFKKKLNFKKLLWVVPGCTIFAWIQFIYFNNADIMKAWEFNSEYWAIFGVNVLIAGGWDIWAANCEVQQWYYRHVLTLEHSNVFNSEAWWWIKIGKGWFPLSIMPQYYFSGSLLCQGIILMTNKFFNKEGNL